MERKKRKEEARERAKQRKAEKQAAKRASKKAEKKTEKATEEKSKYRKPVCICQKDGTIVKRCPSISAASRETGYSTSEISHICRGISKASGDYTFVYENEEDITPRVYTRDYSLSEKPVVQFTKDGEYVARYKSALDAANVINVSRSSVSRGCNNPNKIVNGLKFMFESDYNKINQEKGETR
jgi:hypothetical protein